MLERAQSTSCDEELSIHYPEEVEERLSRLAHDLANLVQVVSGNLELLAEHTTDETSCGFITNASEAARQLARLTRGLQGEAPSRLQRRT